MKKLTSMGLSILTLATSAMPSFAQVASPTSKGVITLNGNVAPTCKLQATTGTGDGNFTGTDGGDGIVLFDAFSNAQGKHASHQFKITFPAASCNYAAKLGLASLKGGMKPTTAVLPSGFTNVVHYTAVATWGTGASAPKTTLNTSAGLKGDKNAIMAGPLAADLNVLITTADTDLPLIADGNPYNDTLTVQVGEQL